MSNRKKGTDTRNACQSFYILGYQTAITVPQVLVRTCLPLSINGMDTGNKNGSKVRQFIRNILVQCIHAIQNRACGDFVKDKTPLFLAKAFYGLEYDSMRKTSHFTVEDTCIGCGLCARNCSVSAIEIREKRPVWVKDECVMCLRCLHHCPKFAIQYGKRTKRHGQYTHPVSSGMG